VANKVLDASAGKTLKEIYEREVRDLLRDHARDRAKKHARLDVDRFLVNFFGEEGNNCDEAE
jgi:hypothetical protein